jgi:hypothetical protein
MSPISSARRGGNVSPLRAWRKIGPGGLGICKRAARQAPSVYFSAASFEEAMLATSVLGLSFCNCS